MIEPLQGMPDGTIGFRASGRVTREEYREMLPPAMRAAAFSVMTLREGLITQVDEFLDRVEALEAVGPGD